MCACKLHHMQPDLREFEEIDIDMHYTGDVGPSTLKSRPNYTLRGEDIKRLQEEEEE